MDPPPQLAYDSRECPQYATVVIRTMSTYQADLSACMQGKVFLFPDAGQTAGIEPITGSSFDTTISLPTATERSTKIHLDLVPSSGSWYAIQLQLTNSVTSDEPFRMGGYTKNSLLANTVHGVTPRQESHICLCEKRMGNKIGPTGLIDFHSPSNIIAPNVRTVQVHFTCSSWCVVV